MKIALDLDMTLNDMGYTWMKWLRKNIDPTITLSNVRYHGFIRDAYGKEADRYWKDPAAYDEIRPLDGAVYFVEQLKLSHEVFILTHTPEGQKSEVKEAWIKSWFGDMRVVHSDKKHLHTDDCLLIDDHPGHIQRHVRHNDTGHGIVFNHNGRYGWAFPLTTQPRVDMCCSYEQVIGVINKL